MCFVSLFVNRKGVEYFDRRVRNINLENYWRPLIIIKKKGLHKLRGNDILYKCIFLSIS